MEGGASAHGALEEPANEQPAAGGSSNGEGGSPAEANEALGGRRPPRGSANEQPEGREAAGEAANEDGGGRRGSANGGAGKEGAANESAGRRGTANERAEPPEPPANQDAAPPAAPPTQEAAPPGLTNEDAAPGGPANEEAAPTHRREAGLPEAANGRPGGGTEPSNENGALPAAANGRPDPWDWASEEAWLRVRVGAEPEEEWAWPEEEWAWPEAEGACPEAEGAGWWRSPDSAFSKMVVRKGRGLGRPGRGSRCRVRVEAPPPWSGWAWPGAGPRGGWGTWRVGEGAGRWAGLLDACLESMRAGEGAWLRPEVAGFGPEVAGIPPEVAGIRSEGAGIPPEVKGIRSEGAGVQPEQAGIRPEVAGIRPEGAELRPEKAEIRPEGAGIQPENAELLSEGAGIRPEVARIQPEGAGFRWAGLRVSLGSFTPPPSWWAEPPGGAGRWAEVRAWRQGAESFLRAGWAEPAARAYSQALRLAVAASGGEATPPLFLNPAHPEVGGGREKAELHAGLALCQLRLGLPAPAATNAGKALALEPGHREARYRRGVAAAAMRDLEAAAADLGQVLREEPGHREARRELRRVRGEARERDARLARRLGRLFA